MDEVIPRMGISKRPSSSLIAGAKTTLNDPTAKQGFPITFKHLGKGGYELTLYATTQVQRRKWMEHIESQQNALRSRSNFFTKTILCDRFFTLSNRVNCLVPIGKLVIVLSSLETLLSSLQMAVESWYTAQITVYSSQIDDLRTSRQNPSVCWMLLALLRSKYSKNINFSWPCQIRHYSRFH